MSIHYEWDVETVNTESDDIEDHNHCATYTQALHYIHQFKPEDGQHYAVVLVRDDTSDGRSWAYMKDGKLPTFFEDAYGNETSDRVPTKYHTEVATS